MKIKIVLYFIFCICGTVESSCFSNCGACALPGGTRTNKLFFFFCGIYLYEVKRETGKSVCVFRTQIMCQL